MESVTNGVKLSKKRGLWQDQLETGPKLTWKESAEAL